MKKRSIPLVLVLSFVTCGIYSLFWMCQTRTEFALKSGRQDINPGLELFLSVLCFPYFYYWIYRFSRDIAAYQTAHDLPVKDNSILNLFLAIFGLGLVAELLIQDQLNEIADC